MTAYSSPGIFNVLDYGMRTNSSGISGAANASNLQSAINAAEATGTSAVILIPSFSVNPSSGASEYGYYPIDTYTFGAPITISGGQDILICGTGQGTELASVAASSAAMFTVTGTGSVTFQDLSIVYGVEGGSSRGTAITCSSDAAHKLFRLLIQNCQNAVAFQGTSHARMLNCFIDYPTAIAAGSESLNAVQITGGCIDTVVSQCLFRCGVTSPKSSFYGIYIDGATGVKVTDTQVEGFGTGILIGESSTTTELSMVGCRAEAFYQSLQINETVFDLSFTDCHFQAASDAITGPGITIGASGGANTQIDTLRFTSCSVTGTAPPESSESQIAYGMQINQGQNIQIHGGDYSGNGPTAGITISGATEVQIVGANCVGLEYEGAKDTPPLTQQYGIVVTSGTDIQIIGVNCSGNGLSGTAGAGDGIHIDGSGSGDVVSEIRIVGVSCVGKLTYSSIVQNSAIFIDSATNVLVQGCDLSGDYSYGLYLESVTDCTVKSCDLFGNGTGLYVGNQSTRVYVRDCNASQTTTEAIDIASSVATVEVTNCAGYNDQYTPPLSTTLPTGPAPFNGVTVASYYGPTVFYVTGVTGRAIMIDGQATQLSTGGFTLAPGETAHIGGGDLDPRFLMIGN